MPVIWGHRLRAGAKVIMMIGAVGKMAKVATAESKMATRVPSTGLKMAKMAT